jgi:hypothetical protein
MDPRWIGDCDPDLQPGLTCDIEIKNESGTVQEINAGTASALREIAAQIESGKVESGFHQIKAPNGLEIGKLYIDHYATGPR